MTNWTRRIGIVLGSLVGLILAVIGIAYIVSAVKFGKRYEIASAAPASLPTDSASLYRGRTLAEMNGCTSCHAANLGGQVMFSAFPMGRVVAPNLSRGRGGVAGRYTDAQWERAIRHGIAADGRPLVIMPSQEFHELRDDDVAQLIAYLKSMEPVDNELPRTALWPVGRVLHAVNAGLVPAEQMDHAARRTPPEPGVTVEYGRYLSLSCRFCHGQTLTGGQPPEPGSPAAPNIAARTASSRWSDDDFIRTMRTGTTPDGRTLSEHMPWKTYARLTDDELRAIWMYVRSVQTQPPPQQAAAR